MDQRDRQIPDVLRQLNSMDFDYADGEGIDFEPFSEFLSLDKTRKWIQAWTGNTSLDGHEYLVFGSDGAGGSAAFWCCESDKDILDQPIVFFGSEGELAVIASNFGDYLWLLAGNLGPAEATLYPEQRVTHADFMKFAEANSTTTKKTSLEVLSLAQSGFPDFQDKIRSLITYS